MFELRVSIHLDTEKLQKAVPTAPFSCGSTGCLVAEKLEGSAADACLRDTVGWWVKDIIYICIYIYMYASKNNLDDLNVMVCSTFPWPNRSPQY